jgi:hypothetical protein
MWGAGLQTARRVLLGAVFTLAFVMAPAFATAAPGDIRVTLMSAKFDWSTTEFSGYSFLCFGVETAAGTNDDCYGFYRSTAGKSFIGGSGVSRSDLRKTPTRFPTPTVVVSRKVSPAQRQAAMRVLDIWNEREYEPSPVNAMEVVREIAQAAGFVVPPRKNEPAEGLLKRLQAFNP